MRCWPERACARLGARRSPPTRGPLPRPARRVARPPGSAPPPPWPPPEADRSGADPPRGLPGPRGFFWDEDWMNVSAEMVKKLRDETGAGMMECKSALVEAVGELEKAREI